MSVYHDLERYDLRMNALVKTIKQTPTEENLRLLFETYTAFSKTLNEPVDGDVLKKFYTGPYTDLNLVQQILTNAGYLVKENKPIRR